MQQFCYKQQHSEQYRTLLYRVSVLPNISVNIGDWYQVNIGWRLKFDKYHRYTICHGLLTVAATNQHLPLTHEKDRSINFALEASVGRNFLERGRSECKIIKARTY